jgi:hypothetical protein
MVVNTCDLSESSCYKASLVFGECAILEFAVEDPLQGDDIHIKWMWYCPEDI